MDSDELQIKEARILRRRKLSVLRTPYSLRASQQEKHLETFQFDGLMKWLPLCLLKCPLYDSLTNDEVSLRSVFGKLFLRTPVHSPHLTGNVTCCFLCPAGPLTSSEPHSIIGN